MNALTKCTFITFLLFHPLMASEGFKGKGELILENHTFKDDGQRQTKDENFSTFLRLEGALKGSSLNSSIRVISRIDKDDKDRNLLEVEEGWVSYRQNTFQIKGGVQMLNWTALEAFHPIDILNSPILDSSIDRPDKLGELMVKVSQSWNSLSLNLYIMPYFKSPIYPSSSSRINPYQALAYELNQKGKRMTHSGKLEGEGAILQGGLDITQTLGDLDIQLFYVHHIDRHHPIFEFYHPSKEVAPIFQTAQKIGTSFSYIYESIILKFEWIFKDFKNKLDDTLIEPEYEYSSLSQKDHQMIAIGFEQLFSYNQGQDGTFLLEYQGIPSMNRQNRQELDLFQNDLLMGYRHSWNDLLSKELTLTCIIDLERKSETLWNLRYEQRLNDQHKIKTSLVHFESKEKDQYANLEKTSRLSIEFTRFF